MLRPQRVVSPTKCLLTLAEAKEHLRRGDDPVEDQLITALCETVHQYFDGYSGILGRALITQTWAQKYAGFDSTMRLVSPDVQSITSVTYFDGDEAEQTLSASVYRLYEDERSSYLGLQSNQSWPSTYTRDDAVTITYVAGYGDNPSDVPQPIRQAAKMLLAHWDVNREAVAPKSLSEPLRYAVDALIAPYRWRP